jgi:hypothetical protein
MNGFRKIFPIFLSHYPTFFAKIAKRKVVPFDEFYYQLKLMYSGEHGISHANLYVIKKKLSSLSFIVIIINNEVAYA